jgi:hypothetical protein
MILTGQVHNGVIVLDKPSELPEGACVRIELLSTANTEKPGSPRVGGIWKGQVQIAEDFDQLPDDLAEAFTLQPAMPRAVEHGTSV